MADYLVDWSCSDIVILEVNLINMELSMMISCLLIGMDVHD